MSEDSNSEGASETTDESNGNDDKKTILYCLTREALKEDDLIDLRDGLPERFHIEPAGDDKIAIKKDAESGTSLDVGSVLSDD